MLLPLPGILGLEEQSELLDFGFLLRRTGPVSPLRCTRCNMLVSKQHVLIDVHCNPREHAAPAAQG
jgi:hypothetical protein